MILTTAQTQQPSKFCGVTCADNRSAWEVDVGLGGLLSDVRVRVRVRVGVGVRVRHSAWEAVFVTCRFCSHMRARGRLYMMHMV